VTGKPVGAVDVDQPTLIDPMPTEADTPVGSAGAEAEDPVTVAAEPTPAAFTAVTEYETVDPTPNPVMVHDSAEVRHAGSSCNVAVAVTDPDIVAVTAWTTADVEIKLPVAMRELSEGD